MAGLYNKYADQGFHIIAIERQNSTADQITTLAKNKKIPYQLTTGGRFGGEGGNGIPQTYLIDPAGNAAGADLRGKALEDKIKLLIKDASVVYPGPGPYVKLAQLAAQVKTGKFLGQSLKTLSAKLNSKDAAEAAEAKMMYDTVHSAAKDSLDSALAEKGSDPVTAIFRLDSLTLRYAGDDIAVTAKKESDALKKDPKVRKELDAEQMWERVIAFQDQLKAVGGSRDPSNEAFKRTNAQAIQVLLGGCQMLTQQFAGTAAASKAEQLAGEFR